MTDLSRYSPRRYFVDIDGQRVVVGLTIEETLEFEALDSLVAAGSGIGNSLREEDSAPAGKQERRWLELYAKHEQAWRKWMADRRANPSRDLPIFN
jgi:hypothetical protein